MLSFGYEILGLQDDSENKTKMLRNTRRTHRDSTTLTNMISLNHAAV